jgi:ATP-dependent DNA helicase DinG
VSFVVRADPNGTLTDARVVARGTIDAVLALPGVAQRGELLIHNHPSGFLEPSGADLHVAARLHDEGVGFGIVNNEVSTLYVVVECPRARTVARLDSLDVANLLTESGPVARVLGTTAFEDRPGQRDMAAYIADAYNDGGIALLEAGTGVGKSFAYLVPALEWARLNGERTVVSTNTINLQEQLVGKDLPILSRAFWSRRARDRSRCSTTAAGPSSSPLRDGPPGRPMAVSPISSRSRPAMSGTRSPPSRISARASNARTSIVALYSRRGVARPKPTSSS